MWPAPAGAGLFRPGSSRFWPVSAERNSKGWPLFSLSFFSKISETLLCRWVAATGLGKSQENKILPRHSLVRPTRRTVARDGSVNRFARRQEQTRAGRRKERKPFRAHANAFHRRSSVSLEAQRRHPLFRSRRKRQQPRPRNVVGASAENLPLLILAKAQGSSSRWQEKNETPRERIPDQVQITVKQPSQIPSAPSSLNDEETWTPMLR